MKKLANNKKGFTYLEMVLSITVMVMIVYVTFIQRKSLESLPIIRNSERMAETLLIAQAVYAYNIDNGSFPKSLTSSFQEICSSEDESICKDSELLYIPEIVNFDKYLVSMPTDPLVSRPNSSGYKIAVQDGRVVVIAPLAELKEEIKITL